VEEKTAGRRRSGRAERLYLLRGRENLMALKLPLLILLVKADWKQG
jgi:hypothetical protein